MIAAMRRHSTKRGYTVTAAIEWSGVHVYPLSDGYPATAIGMVALKY
jgi:hypothetical protein